MLAAVSPRNAHNVGVEQRILTLKLTRRCPVRIRTCDTQASASYWCGPYPLFLDTVVDYAADRSVAACPVS